MRRGKDGALLRHRVLDHGAKGHLLPGPGEAKRAILDSYTKEHSAEYQAQAWIDLARKLHGTHPELADPANVDAIVLHTSHHTHYVIGSGANDPQKYDPKASRETLDHSIPYIFAVALQDGGWHHVDSYLPERAARPEGGGSRGGAGRAARFQAEAWAKRSCAARVSGWQ